MKRKKPLVRCIVFLIILGITVCAVQGMFGIDDDRAFAVHKDFANEKERPIDGVFVGASNVHAFWQPAMAWAGHGIAVLNYAFSALPMGAVKYLIIEARKTQPDALYIINLNTFKYINPKDKVADIHRPVDYMPLSQNKLDLIDAMVEQSELTDDERMELLIPFIQFHSRWYDLKSWSYGVPQEDYLGSLSKDYFFKIVTDITPSFKVNDQTAEVGGDTMAVFTDLLDYLDREHVNALFVKVPQVLKNLPQGRMKTLEGVLEERGYPCVDMLGDVESLGLNLNTDFYNITHTNVHGSMKIVEYLSNYLIEHYHFTDKRGEKGWEKWDELAGQYMALLSQYLLPFEFEHAPRYQTDIPALNKPTVEGQSVTVSWEAVEGAEGYEVYRKQEGTAWERCAATDAQTLSYADAGLEPGAEYTYTVVPCATVDGRTRYGSYKAAGVTGKTEAGGN